MLTWPAVVAGSCNCHQDPIQGFYHICWFLSHKTLHDAEKSYSTFSPDVSTSGGDHEAENKGCFHKGLIDTYLSSIPSVIYLSCVIGDVTSSNLIE